MLTPKDIEQEYRVKMDNLLNQFNFDRILLLDFHNKANELERELGDKLKKINNKYI